ncbi:Sensors of blue-light using FAD [Bryocella elongata]|uniref:Sensors of blue-light using FAD n=1 Tax=Bryocella elongata TaxID=863522 RepID=A0A1H6BXW8_9BACT|nr:BLUF domain-containing protein [Bryocella elongata]SEG65540.1 Sensors of blue-light using FAD [Bryocella elongata]
MSELMHCIYASAAVHDYTTVELAKLLQRSQQNNQRCGVTGVLLYVEGNFFQVLEGRPADVIHTYEKISQDSRHTRVTRIISESIHRRAFSDWSMGFLSLSQQQLADMLGARDFSDRTQSIQPIVNGRARKLLEAFCEGRWRTKLPAPQQLFKMSA